MLCFCHSKLLFKYLGGAKGASGKRAKSVMVEYGRNMADALAHSVPLHRQMAKKSTRESIATVAGPNIYTLTFIYYIYFDFFTLYKNLIQGLISLYGWLRA